MNQYNLDRISQPRAGWRWWARVKAPAASAMHESKNMLALGKKLGFDTKRDPDSGENELTIYFPGNRT